MNQPLSIVFGSPRRLLAWIAVACAALLAFAIYLQQAVGLEPCPMCIVQRYAFAVLGILAFIGSLWGNRLWVGLFALLSLLTSGFGAFVAARQSFLQWFPPEFATCGRDFYGIIESTMPWRNRIPMLFQGSGDCSLVDWTFLGLSIANWSFICFALIFVSLVAVGARCLCSCRRG